MTSDNENDDWHKVTRGIKPYKTDKEKNIKNSPMVKKQPAVKSGNKGNKNSVAAKISKKKPAKTVFTEARLDLHGMTQDKAFKALENFIELSVQKGQQNLLVITGKGNQSQGILKRMLPLWLEAAPLKKHVKTITPAEPKNGGAGAFYIKLKKQQ